MEIEKMARKGYIRKHKVRETVFRGRMKCLTWVELKLLPSPVSGPNQTNLQASLGELSLPWLDYPCGLGRDGPLLVEPVIFNITVIYSYHVSPFFSHVVGIDKKIILQPWLMRCSNWGEPVSFSRLLALVNFCGRFMSTIITCKVTVRTAKGASEAMSLHAG
jgi:hypothetical protein